MISLGGKASWKLLKVHEKKYYHTWGMDEDGKYGKVRFHKNNFENIYLRSWYIYIYMKVVANVGYYKVRLCKKIKL